MIRVLKIIVLLPAFCLPLHSFAQPNAKIEYVDQFGERGNNGPAGQFYYPLDVDADSQGNLLIVEWGNSRVQRCTVEGQCEIVISGLPYQPDSLVVDDNDRIVLTENHGIRICEVDGDCSNTFGGFGSEVGKFNDPRGIALDSQGRLVIADRYNDRVQLCDFEGNCTAFGTFNSGPDAMPGEFWEPAGIATDRKGAIYVGETGDEVVSICNETGACSARIGREGREVGEFKTPFGLGLTSRGDLVVFEVSNDRVQLCDLEGACFAYGKRGIGAGEFRAPRSIYIDENDRVYVADQDNHRIQVLQITYDPESEFTINPGLNDAWYNPLTSGQGVLIAVYPAIQSVFLAWFTYDTERPPEDVTAMLGEPGHRWLTAQGSYEGDTAYLTIYETVGGVFDAAEPKAATDPAGDGTITLEFADCTEALMSYEITSLGISGDIPLERIVTDNVARCEELADP